MQIVCVARRCPRQLEISVCVRTETRHLAASRTRPLLMVGDISWARAHLHAGSLMHPHASGALTGGCLQEASSTALNGGAPPPPGAPPFMSLEALLPQPVVLDVTSEQLAALASSDTAAVGRGLEAEQDALLACDEDSDKHMDDVVEVLLAERDAQQPGPALLLAVPLSSSTGATRTASSYASCANTTHVVDAWMEAQLQAAQGTSRAATPPPPAAGHGTGVLGGSVRLGALGLGSFPEGWHGAAASHGAAAGGWAPLRSTPLPPMAVEVRSGAWEERLASYGEAGVCGCATHRRALHMHTGGPSRPRLGLHADSRPRLRQPCRNPQGARCLPPSLCRCQAIKVMRRANTYGPRRHTERPCVHTLPRSAPCRSPWPHALRRRCSDCTPGQPATTAPACRRPSPSACGRRAPCSTPHTALAR